ncbi:hypothetical protein G7Y79_00015g039450 [Physcia stellaris]|nr:hypothetical protein G7Y79_00015g039450 [Physcia stellaris]
MFDQLQDQKRIVNSMVGLVEERDRIVKERDRLLMEKSELVIERGNLQLGTARCRDALALRDAELRKIQNANARQSGDDGAAAAMEYVGEVEERANAAEKLVEELRQ